jgi:SAM-dependent methyltransferase
MKENIAKRIVREAYGKIAKGKNKSCGCGCTDAAGFAKSIGYSEGDLSAIPEEANLGLSCGNPTVLAALKQGEVVVDLGSGAGFDCFLAAAKVGAQGKVIGVDMTSEMVEKARAIAGKRGMKNVEFRLGEIEKIPLSDNSADVVMSNCVVNLSPDKAAVFREIRRVLKPGGRIAISDIALLKKLPEAIEKSVRAYVGCVAGALPIEEYKKAVEAGGLRDVKISITGGSACIDPGTKDPLSRALLASLPPGQSLDDYVASVYVEGRK